MADANPTPNSTSTSTSTSRTPWTGKDIPSLDGKFAIVTGATGGLGFETALALAGAGASVILAGRNETKGSEALKKILELHPQAKAKVSFGKVDLTSLASVREFAKGVNDSGNPLHILINNAGVMALPKREVTSDGFEVQFGTNHLAHFALTAQLLPALKKAGSAARVVNTSSWVAKHAKMNWDDLQWEKSYSQFSSYYQTKLANLFFTLEFQRRAESGNWGVVALSAHPGYSRTDLVANGMGDTSLLGRLANIFTKPLFSQAASEGALPQLYAATCADAKGGEYYGPAGFMELKGQVTKVSYPTLAKDEEMGKKLWEVSNELCGVSWPA